MLYLAIQSGLVLAQEAESLTDEPNAFVSLLPIVLIIALGYMLFIRPQRKRARDMDQLRSSIDVGSDVRTVGGIYGTVLEMDDAIVVLDTGSGGRLRVARRAIAEMVGGTSTGDDSE